MPTTSARPSFWNRLWYLIGRLGPRLLGWRVPGKLPDDPKYVIIAAHTSSWDYVHAMLGMAYLTHGFTNIHFAWMGKKELFQSPIGWFLRWTGGISIDRSKPGSDTVQQSIDEFSRHERMALIITPEATRKRGRRWKTGFYHIALGAGVPIVCGFLDFRRKMVGPGLVIYPSGDMAADMCLIRDFYRGMQARFPDQVSEPWVPGMENCPETGKSYETWLAANADHMGLSKGDLAS